MKYAAWLVFMLLSGCTVGPDFVRPQAPAADHYNHGGDSLSEKTQHFEEGVKPVANWWKLFGSEKLDAVVATGIAGNPGLQAAQASLMQSRDNLMAGYGIFYPQASFGGNAARHKFSPAEFGSSAPSPIFNLITLSASVSYALDIFGGERRTIENLQSQVDMERAFELGTYLALSGNLVNTAITVAAYREELRDTEKLVELQKAQVEIAEKQAQAGTVSYETVLSYRNQLASIEALLPPLRQRIDQAKHLLATLGGHAPSEYEVPEIAFSEISLPREIPLSLPSDLVRQRPDILAAEAALHAASANIGVATAALFPSFTLNAAYGQNATSMNGLFASKGSFWNLGTNIAAPVFDGGTLRAMRQASIDAYKQNLSLYRQTVLSALAQVADTIRALEHDAQTVKAESLALTSSEASLHLARANYSAGTVNYLQVLTADIQYRQARIGVLQARTQRLQDTTALFVSLGGGWRKSSGR